MTLYTRWPVASWLPELRDRPFSHHPRPTGRAQDMATAPSASSRWSPGSHTLLSMLLPDPSSRHSRAASAPGPDLSGGDGHLDAARTWRVQLHALPRELAAWPQPRASIYQVPSRSELCPEEQLCGVLGLELREAGTGPEPVLVPSLCLPQIRSQIQAVMFCCRLPPSLFSLSPCSYLAFPTSVNGPSLLPGAQAQSEEVPCLLTFHIRSLSTSLGFPLRADPGWAVPVEALYSSYMTLW